MVRRITASEIESEPYEVLLQRCDAGELEAAILSSLSRDRFSSFEAGFELAARFCAVPATKQAIEWLRRYGASGRGVPDAVPFWDVASRNWMLKLSRSNPALVTAERERLSKPHQQLADFCLAVAHGRPLPEEVADAVARHFLNAGPGSYAYAELLPIEQVARCAEGFLARANFPILRRERVEELLAVSSAELTLALAVNYCGQDFRAMGIQLLQNAPAASTIDERRVERRIVQGCSAEGRIVLGLLYARLVGHTVESLPGWAREALLLDLRSGSLDDLNVTLDSLLDLRRELARELLSEALREQRATLMVPALADEQLLSVFLARIEEGAVDRETAVLALSRCGQEGVSVLLALDYGKRPAASLVSVVAEALGLLLEGSGLAQQERAAALLVPWLGHPSKVVSGAARRTLEAFEQVAVPALRLGLEHERKAVRVESARLLEWFGLRQPEQTTPLDVVRQRAVQLRVPCETFLALCERLLQQGERWALELRPWIRKHGAVCLQWLRPWFEHHVPHGDVRLWCYVVELLAADDEAAWVAVDTFARMPKLPTSLWARPRRALSKMGARLAGPVAYVLTNVSTEYREPLYRLLAFHGVAEAESVLLAGLTDESKPIRGHAVDGLSRLPTAPLDDVLPLLRSSNPGVRIAAAELLAVWGKPEARTALSAALDSERRAQGRVYLEEALVASGAFEYVISEGAADATTEAPDALRVARFLERRAAMAKVPRFLTMSEPPPLRFKDGSELSADAKHGVLFLVMQLDSTLKGRLLREVCRQLDSASLAQWSRHVHERWLRSKDSRFKWALYQLWLLADEPLIEEVSAALGRLRANEHVIVACYLRVLQWRASKPALDWLVHWGNALPSRGLRELARTLLRRVALKRQVPVAEVLAGADPWIAAEQLEAEACAEVGLDRRARERWIAHLEGALLTGRRWSANAWMRLNDHFAQLMTGLVWVVEHTSGVAELALFDGQRLLDLRAQPLGFDTHARLRLAHPLDCSPDEREGLIEAVEQLSMAPPFEQMRRGVFFYGEDNDLLLSELDTDSERLDHWMRRKGWFHGEPLDHGIVYSNTKRVGPLGLVFRVTHTGYSIGRHDIAETVVVRGFDAFDQMGNAVDFADVADRVYSEVCFSLRQINRPLDES